jgi:hypothetical protein
MLVARSLWHQVGGYSIEFSPGMSSDNDFSMKLWRAGCRVFLGVGDSLTYHFSKTSTACIRKGDSKQAFVSPPVTVILLVWNLAAYVEAAVLSV